MAKLEEADNIEHYLTTFERLAIAFGWRRATWAVHLIPLLTGKARSAFVAMNPEDATDYDRLKEAVLKKYEINAETYRQQFRALETSSTETPQELYVRLKDLFCKWTGYEKSSKENLMETLVLEQYLRVLYPDVRTWVRERNPKTAAEAAMLVESYVAAHRGPRGYRYAGVLEQSTRGQDLPVLTELVTKTAWCGVVTRAQAREQQAALTELPYFGEDVPVDPTLSRQERCDGRRQMIENTVKQNEMQVSEKGLWINYDDEKVTPSKCH
ncbi:hypothetical protein ACEWY4_016693 [Coilia grayii]|uniref:SCAN box domain-containing protein n=1 Tax=Coilia grayii TaxID=363190 RepID=A0ABD1JMI8_9TELE